MLVSAGVLIEADRAILEKSFKYGRCGPSERFEYNLHAESEQLMRLRACTPHRHAISE